MVQLFIELGWAVPTWKGPEFKARRSSKIQGVAGKACLFQVSLQVGRGSDECEILETMAHELAHVASFKEVSVDHGPLFRSKLRQLVRARWPDIRQWKEIDRPGAKWAYFEDALIIDALRDLYLRERYKARLA